MFNMNTNARKQGRNGSAVCKWPLPWQPQTGCVWANLLWTGLYLCVLKLTPHLLPQNAKRKWLLSLNGKYRNLNTLRTFLYKNQTRRQSPENGTVEKNLCCLSETSSADITATSGKTVDCIVIWQAGHSPKTIQPTTSPQRTVTLWSQEAQAVFPDSWIAWWQPRR